MEFPRGSVWRKWDLHVHTPFSYHNDFPDWQEYLVNLKENAITHGIEVAGITDYFSVDGYEKLLEECELESKFTSPRINLGNGQYLYLLPAIEVRLDNFSADSNAVNIHVLFSPKLKPDLIRDRFLENLEITYREQKLKCKTSDLIRIGHAEVNKGSFDPTLDTSTFNEVQKSQFIKKALSAITFSSSIFKDKLEEFRKIMHNAGLNEELYLIIVANKGHGSLSEFKWLDGLRNTSRAGIIRQNLLNLSDICFSNSLEDKEFLLGKNSGCPAKEIKNRFRSFKPCIWGSDAHHIDNLFHPSNGATYDYTWVKADPTFEGLKQIVCEPEERVRIQETQPETKEDYRIIDKVLFKDPAFTPNEILFNQNLNVIIGSRSSGKTTLLRHIAYTIDPVQVTEDRETDPGRQYDWSNVEIYWRDGTKNEPSDFYSGKSLIYIPQSYINRMAEVENENSPIIQFIEKALFSQEESLEKQKTKLDDDERIINKEIESKISDLFSTLKDIDSQNNKIKTLGDRKGIEGEIKKLDKEIKDLQKNLTEEEIIRFNHIVTLGIGNKGKIEKLESDIAILEEWEKGSDFLPNFFVQAPSPLKDEDLVKAFEEKTKTLQENFEKEFVSFIKIKIRDLKSVKEELQEQNRKLKTGTDLEILNKGVNNKSAALKKTEKENQHMKLLKITQEESILKKLEIEKSTIKTEIIELYKERTQLKKQYASKASKEMNGISFSAEVVLNINTLDGFIESCLNLHNSPSAKLVLFRDKDTFFRDGELVRTALIQEGKIEQTLDLLIEERLKIKAGCNLENVVRQLLFDYQFVKYDVEYEGDDYEQMTPGKKALVILKLLIESNEEKCPILIDQPEDDLDSRSIYDEVVPFLKEKKRERQIILVSHNANIAVGADAEEIIVANRHSKKTPNQNGYKFDYITGSIEDTFQALERKTILQQQGIQEHICEILEGGKVAFEKRKNRYKI